VQLAGRVGGRNLLKLAAARRRPSNACGVCGRYARDLVRDEWFNDPNMARETGFAQRAMPLAGRDEDRALISSGPCVRHSRRSLRGAVSGQAGLAQQACRTSSSWPVTATSATQQGRVRQALDKVIEVCKDGNL